MMNTRGNNKIGRKRQERMKLNANMMAWMFVWRETRIEKDYDDDDIGDRG